MTNCSARLIYKAPKSTHITPFLFDLRWLPFSSRIQYKMVLTCFHIVSGTVPAHLSELFHLYSPSRFLRSASDTRIVRVHGMGSRTHREKSFQYIGPVNWNSLPVSGLCQVFFFTVFFSDRTGGGVGGGQLKKHLFFSAESCDLLLLSFVPTRHQ